MSRVTEAGMDGVQEDIQRTESGTEREAGLKNLRGTVVPRVKQAPGFQSGTWLDRFAGKGLSVVVFDGEENAQAMAAPRA